MNMLPSRIWNRATRSSGPRERSKARLWRAHPAPLTAREATGRRSPRRSIIDTASSLCGAITCTGWPSTSAKVVRSVWCRRATSRKAAASTAGDMISVSMKEAEML